MAALKAQSAFKAIYLCCRQIMNTFSSNSTTVSEGVGAPWDLRLMAFLPPSLFMNRRELFIYRFVAPVPRACIIIGDMILSTFTIVHQLGALKGGSGHGGGGWQRIMFSVVPVFGSLCVGYGLSSSNIKPSIGFYLRLSYNVMLVLFNVLSYFIVASHSVTSKQSSASGVNPVIKAYKHSKWSLAVLYPLCAILTLIVVEYYVSSV